MFVGGVLGTWASLYLVTALVVQSGAPEACGVQPSDRVVALVPAVLSFVGAVAVAWWNRPTRRLRRRSNR